MLYARPTKGISELLLHQIIHMSTTVKAIEDSMFKSHNPGYNYYYYWFRTDSLIYIYVGWRITQRKEKFLLVMIANFNQT